MNYSVLMSVYKNENPQFFQEALCSIFNQTILTNDFVIICDGPLTKELDDILSSFKKSHEDIINVHRLEQNVGLGKALKFGLSFCKNEIVLRADSDDINMPKRAEIQLGYMEKFDLVSSSIYLFSKDKLHPHGMRCVPELQKQIVRFSKKRCPFNHPAVMFKKSKVETAGSYDHLLFKEDWLLWIKMINCGCLCYNIQEPLVLMRENGGTINRRRNQVAHESLKSLFKYMRDIRYISSWRYIINRIMYSLQYHLPHWFTSLAYKLFFRKQYRKEIKYE